MIKRVRIKAKVKESKKYKYFKDLYDYNGEYMYLCCMGHKNAPKAICNGDKTNCEIGDDIKYDKVETISKDSTVWEIEKLRKKYYDRYCNKCTGCSDAAQPPSPTIKFDEYNEIYIGCPYGSKYRIGSPDGGYCV